MSSESRDLLHRCASGSQPACDQFFVIWKPIFHRIALRLSRQFGVLGEADDVTQEICLKIMASKSSLADSAPEHKPAFDAYFRVLAANAARDWLRKSGRHPTLLFEEQETAVSFAPHGDRSLEKELLIKQIEQTLDCADRERTIFGLYYRQGFSAREIASIPALRLSTKGVETIILRLSRQVRLKLAVESPGEGKYSPKSS